MSGSLWATRRARAAHLLREAPHAEGLLAFYIRLSEIQERVADRVPVQEWLERSEDASRMSLHLELLPREEMRPAFDDFLREVALVGTDVITARSLALLDTDPSERAAALAEPLRFHVRAFLEPVITTLAAAHSREAMQPPTGPEERHESHCPECRSLPIVGVLHDLPDALGARSLQCSLCATRWRVDRLHCGYCGERSAESLRVHAAESLPWVRIDECLTCRRYLKTVDLRQRGDAVPVVDELATVELDIWAQQQGLTKVQMNVLEL